MAQVPELQLKLHCTHSKCGTRLSGETNCPGLSHRHCARKNRYFYFISTSHKERQGLALLHSAGFTSEPFIDLYLTKQLSVQFQS